MKPPALSPLGLPPGIATRPARKAAKGRPGKVSNRFQLNQN
ncbi:hypothetical protein [Azonexus hydrophilus]|nr:hypothetical protein [Azonexus hydrophilus]